MDQRKLNEIMQRIEAISDGELNIKVHLYEQLLPYTLGCFGFYDNAMEFLKEAEKGPEGSSASSAASVSSATSAPSRVSRFSQAPSSAVSSAAPSSSMSMGGSSAYSAAPGFAPNRIPSTPSMGGYSLGSGRKGHSPLRAPLSLAGASGVKKGRRNTRRRR